LDKLLKIPIFRYKNSKKEEGLNENYISNLNIT